MGSRKIVINQDFGGFSLSDRAIERYCELKGIRFEKMTDRDTPYYYHAGSLGDDEQMIWENNFDRDDPALVQTVEELGEEAYGRYAILKIVEIPDDVEWVIQEYDGRETIHEKHRIWA